MIKTFDTLGATFPDNGYFSSLNKDQINSVRNKRRVSMHLMSFNIENKTLNFSITANITCKEIFVSSIASVYSPNFKFSTVRPIILVQIEKESIDIFLEKITEFEKEILKLEKTTEIVHYKDNTFLIFPPRRWLRFPISMYLYLTYMRNILLDGKINFDKMEVSHKLFTTMPGEFNTEKNILRILKYLKENGFENVFESSKKSKAGWKLSVSGANILYTNLIQQPNIETLKAEINAGHWAKFGVKDDFLIEMYNKYKTADENSTNLP